MKLRNKKTGEIGHFTSTNWNEVALIIMDDNGVQLAKYSSLARLTKEWEDAPEEPKEWWYIDIHGPHEVTNNDKYCQQVKAASKEVGNYFSTREEAKKAVEKLKSWKRLKDKGFRFTLTPVVGSLDVTPGKFQIEINADMPAKWFCCDAVQEDLTLLFGGEE